MSILIGLVVILIIGVAGDIIFSLGLNIAILLVFAIAIIGFAHAIGSFILEHCK